MANYTDLQNKWKAQQELYSKWEQGLVNAIISLRNEIEAKLELTGKKWMGLAQNSEQPYVNFLDVKTGKQAWVSSEQINSNGELVVGSW